MPEFRPFPTISLALYGLLLRIKQLKSTLKSALNPLWRVLVNVCQQALRDYEQDNHSATHFEHYRSGYPRFAALLGAHPSFNIYRRFSSARARLILAKQDRLSFLEAQLEQVDDEEKNDLFLGNMRRDLNPTRKQILTDMDNAFADYDNFVERSNRISNLATASPRDIASVRNWTDGTASLARDETAYLLKANDLFSAGPVIDDGYARIEPILETLASRAYERFSKLPGLPLSPNPGVFIIAHWFVKPVTQVVLALLLIALLLTPVAAINALTNLGSRMLVICVATLMIVAGLSSLTRARTIETFLAGATYTTVLVVFIAGNGLNTCQC